MVDMIEIVEMVYIIDMADIDICDVDDIYDIVVKVDVNVVDVDPIFDPYVYFWGTTLRVNAAGGPILCQVAEAEQAHRIKAERARVAVGVEYEHNMNIGA